MASTPINNDPNEPTDMTELANKSSRDKEAREQLLNFLIEKLSEQIKYRRPISHTFQNDDWMSEVTLKLVTTLSKEKKWENRRRLYSYVYQAKESVVIDYWRSKKSAKHGGGIRPLSLDSFFPDTLPNDKYQATQLKQAMDCLKEKNEDLYDLIRDKYYGRMTLTELAAEHGISEYLIKQKLDEAHQILKEYYEEDE